MLLPTNTEFNVFKKQKFLLIYSICTCLVQWGSKYQKLKLQKHLNTGLFHVWCLYGYGI